MISRLGEDRVNDGQACDDATQPNWPFKLFFQAPVTTSAGPTTSRTSSSRRRRPCYSGKLWLGFGSGERRHLPFLGVAASDENNRFYVMSDLDPYERARRRARR